MAKSELVFTLAQKLRRVAWSNHFTLGIATCAVNTAYLASKAIKGRKRGAAALATGETAPDLAAYRRYKVEFAHIGGSFWDGAIVTWDVLLSLQEASGIAGSLLEIGVLKGRSAALLALHAREETLFLVDPALRREATDAVEAAHPERNVYVRAKSQDIWEEPRLALRAGTFRWVHIDGEHTGQAVEKDLDIAERVLGRRGVICLDDFFTPAYPQITAATFAWLAPRRDAFSLFLSGYNKGYICRAADAPFFLSFIKDRMLEEFGRRGFREVTIWKTTEPADMNCFGVTPRYLENRYRGPDWAPDTIPI